MENNENQEEIIINFMYSGGFLKNNNIGHEIINLFKADNGKNYIYVLPLGTIGKGHKDRIKTILLARFINKKTCEILAKATVLNQIDMTFDSKKASVKQKEDIQNYQNEYIKTNGVEYGGVLLNKFFEGNEDSTYIHLTFEAKNVIKPIKPMYLICTQDNQTKHQSEGTQKANEKEDGYYIELKTITELSNRGSRLYFSSVENSTEYAELQNIINTRDYWKDENETVKLDNDTSNPKKKSVNFLQIMKKDHEEVIFSNLLAYFFTINKDAFCRFAARVLHIESFNKKFEVIRESEKNIDLFIKGESHVIVIENKIKSGINGQVSKGKNHQDQLDKYYKHVNEKYQKESKEESEKKYSCHFFILVPNYSQLNHQTSEENGKKIIRKKNESGEIVYEYTLINYSDVYDFFKNDEVKSLYKDEKYFDEFLSALVVHTKTIDNSNEEDMYRRFSVARAAIIKEEDEKQKN